MTDPSTPPFGPSPGTTPGSSDGPSAGASLAAGLAAISPAGPVRVEPLPGSRRVAVIIVTWNRRTPLDHQLRAVAAQTFGAANLDVVVVDNASTDGTAEALRDAWRPEAIIANGASVAHEPAFESSPEQARIGSGAPTNAGGFRSLTVVRNRSNFGGCGGFNTGFAFVGSFIATRAGAGASLPPLEFVWLVDDDAEVATTALEHLASAMSTDERIGLVGSRTVDWNDRTNTIESTIYMDLATGRMNDAPSPGHRLFESHNAWAKAVGGPKGRNVYAGLREVDVCSACSLLARWSAVEKVGYWDYRYFIYCDDADWCLRFPKHGYKVVNCLDAEVYHTPWLMKLTPSRLYYAQRNVVWMIQKIIDPKRVRRVTFRWLAGFLKEAALAVHYRRLFHAELYRRTADDICDGRWGKLDDEGPASEGVCDGLDRIGALRADAVIALLLNRPGMIEWADELRSWVINHLIAHGRAGDLPRFVYVVRNDIPDPSAALSDRFNAQVQPERIIYSHRKRSKIYRQWPLLKVRPQAVVVWDQLNDFPLLRGSYNVHMDRRQLTRAQIERGGQWAKCRMLARIAVTAIRCVAYSFLRPFTTNTTVYGGSGRGSGRDAATPNGLSANA